MGNDGGGVGGGGGGGGVRDRCGEGREGKGGGGGIDVLGERRAKGGVLWELKED